jgi:hypothetical protein
MRGAGRGKGSSIGGGIVQWLLEKGKKEKKKDTILNGWRAKNQ